MPRACRVAAAVLALLVVLFDAASVFFLFLNPEGYWDHAKINGWEALGRLGPLYVAELASSLALLVAAGRGSAAGAWGAGAARALLGAYTGLHICASCTFSPGEAGAIVLAVAAAGCAALGR